MEHGAEDRNPSQQNLRSDLRRNMLEFLRAEIALSFTLAAVAENQFISGEASHAKHTLRLAERGCATAERFLSDAKYNRYIEGEEQVQLQAQVHELRGELDKVRSS